MANRNAIDPRETRMKQIRYSRIAKGSGPVALSKSNPQVVLRPSTLFVLLHLALELRIRIAQNVASLLT